jgi:hypothetical protein
MLDAWTRPDYRYLAEECRRLAASTLSGQMKKRYLLMAKDYTLLSDLEEQAYVHAFGDGCGTRKARRSH